MTKHKFDLEDRTLEFAKKVVRLCKSLPSDRINNEIISQLIRSSGSVGANYREANDALSKKDFVYHIKISRKEAKETHYWLELLKDANANIDHNIDGIVEESVELKKILSSIASKG
jgi:four helix bundle protein